MKNNYEIYTSCLEDDPVAKYITSNLIDYNFSQVAKQIAPFTIAIKQNGTILAGAECVSTWDWMHVKHLWVKASERRKRYGTILLRHIEQEALKRECVGIHLDTFSFQAKDFYLKLGFTIFGQLDDQPRGHKRFYLSKILNH